MSGPRPAAVAAGLAGAATLIAGITVLSRVAGFGRVLVFAPTVSSGCIGTAYTSANQLPNVLFEVVAGGALAGAVVPLLAGPLARGQRQEADRIASALLGWALAVLLPVGLLLAALAGPLARLVLGDGCAGGSAVAARMLLVFAPQVLLYGIGIVLTGVLQAHQRFAWPAAAPLLSSLVVICSYLLFGAIADGAQRDPAWLPDRGGELVLAGGTTLGVVALSLPLLWPVHRTGTRLRPTLRFPADVAARARGLALAGIGALLAQQAAVLATLLLANRVGGVGAFPVTQYVQAVYLLPYAVLAVPLATAAFPQLAALHAEGRSERFAVVAARSTRLVLLLSWAGVAALVAAAPAVQALFGHLDVARGGPLGAMAATLTAFAPGLVGWGLVAHLGRALYAAGEPRAAAVATATGWLAAVLGSLAAVLLLRADGGDAPAAAVVGLGLGNTLGMSVAGVLLLRALHRVTGAAGLDGVARALVAGGVAAAAGGVLGRLVADGTTGGDGAGPGTAVLAGLLAAVAALGAAGVLLAGLDRRDLRELRGLRGLRGPRETGPGEPR